MPQTLIAAAVAPEPSAPTGQLKPADVGKAVLHAALSTGFVAALLGIATQWASSVPPGTKGQALAVFVTSGLMTLYRLYASGPP